MCLYVRDAASNTIHNDLEVEEAKEEEDDASENDGEVIRRWCRSREGSGWVCFVSTYAHMHHPSIERFDVGRVQPG